MTYGGYAHCKMSVNGVSTIFGLPSLLICVLIGSDNLYMGYWLALSANEQATRSLPHFEIKRQRRVNDFWSCKSGNLKAIWSFLYIIKVLAAYKGKTDSYTLRAPA